MKPGLTVEEESRSSRSIASVHCHFDRSSALVRSCAGVVFDESMSLNVRLDTPWVEDPRFLSFFYLVGCQVDSHVA